MCLRLIAETDAHSVGDSHPSCLVCVCQYVGACVLHQVPMDWFNSMLQCGKQNNSACQLAAVDAAVYQTLGISDARLLLSPSCKQCLSEWQRISMVAIEKQSTQVARSVFIPVDLVNHSFVAISYFAAYLSILSLLLQVAFILALG